MDSPVTAAQISEALLWRYATKKFDSQKKIAPNLWLTLEHALLLAPSSFGLQPWKFIVVTDQSTKDALRAAAWNQAQVSDCSHVVVLAQKRHVAESDVRDWIERIAEVRTIPSGKLDGYAQVMTDFCASLPEHAPWTARQCYLALGFLLLSAAALRIDACPMEGIEPQRFDDIVKLEGSGYATVSACALGYRSSSDVVPLKVRKLHSEVIQHFNP